jgi:SAM-dependent methyltransferase
VTDFNSIGAIQGYYQSLLLLHFTRSGVFERLRKSRTAEDLARECDWQPDPLRSCLDFLAATTGLVRRDRKGRYLAILPPGQFSSLAFEIEKFIGAYGQTALKLPVLLSGKITAGRALVDHRSLARAFSSIADVSRGLVTAMIVGARPATLLDLGCGTGSLLVQLAKLDPEFHGIGIDVSKPMCKAAKNHAAGNKVSSRVRIACQDARDVRRLPDASALHAASLFNEMFAHGSGEAITYLGKLKERFKGCDIWLVDYYGRLGVGRNTRARDVGHALLHDLVQVLSGQGVPPPDLKSWRAIYRAAGCKLVEAHEFSGSGLDWFIHRVRFR